VIRSIRNIRWLTWVELLAFSLLVLYGCDRPPEDSATPARVAASSAPSPIPKEPHLSIKVGDKERTWSRSELLAHPDIKSLTIMDGSAYEHRNRTYTAIPIVSLFDAFEIPEGRTIEYETTDGFSSSIRPSRLLNTSGQGSIAHLAVEDPAAPWSNFENRTYGPGPFYLVWERPDASDIGREEWPFKLTAFRDRLDIDERYPKLPPSAELSRDHPVRDGYRLFLKNCFPCHKINGEGQATFGPDLNHPMSPTEYLADGMIQKLVRDPQSVRTWTGGKMPPFDRYEISDEELDLIVGYLEHKAKTRPDSQK
jgi:mono/diheme cytochrome c family protein